MEGAAEGNDATATGGGAGDLHSIFDSLGTCGDKDGLPGAFDGHDLVETLGQAHIAVIGGDLVAHVRELLELLARRPDDLGMAMAGVDDGNAGCKVDVTAALGVPEFLKADMVRPGAVIIDVGTTRVPDASRKSGFKLTGDVAFDEVAPLASYITPVPGGVGPMTIISLMLNTLRAAKLAEGN